MKKIIILAVMTALITSVCYAQLKVDSLGHVGIGAENMYNSKLTVGKMGHNNFAASIQSLSSGALYLSNDTTFYKNAGFLQYNKLITKGTSTSWNAYGIFSEVEGIYNKTSVRGIVGRGIGGKTCAGVVGAIVSGSASQASVGVVGTTGAYGSLLSLQGGTYAGYFLGNVRVTGTIYGTLVSPSTVSSPSQGGTTINLSEEATRGESITEKLRQVDLLQMERINQDGSIAANKAIKKATCINDEGEEVPAEDPVQTKLSSVSYGLAADQLNEVYPELVYEDKEGNYSINYIEIVPLLVQSIRELSAKVEALEAERDNPKAIKAKSSQMDIADNVNLSIPDKAQKIQLNIYDLSGKTVRTTDVNESGNINLSAYTKGLPTGTYAYSLIVDGKKKKARKIMVK